MGNVVPTGRASGDTRDLLGEFDGSSYSFQETLWNGKFLKSVRSQRHGNNVVVKVYEKIPGGSEKTIAKIRKDLEEIRDAFEPRLHPNVIPYSRWGESEHGCFIVRQFLSNNLLDRQNMRPFLDTIEKRWVAFQLLKALSQCHQAKVVHGDIKSQNFLVTSWNWVVLTDFAPFKPTLLPLDDTAPYNYFFASSTGRDCCCVAPERFCPPTATIDVPVVGTENTEGAYLVSVMMDSNVSSADADHYLADFGKSELEHTKSPRSRAYSFGSSNRLTRLRPSMDIFSLGCVIMEVFQDGEPCFGLAELLRYAKHDAENQAHLTTKLNKLKYQAVRPLVQHMLGDDPTKRLSADAYLQEYLGQGKLFPAYFEEFLHPLMARLLSPEFDVPDERIWLIAENYAKILSSICCGVSDVNGTKFFSECHADWMARKEVAVDKLMSASEHFRAEALDAMLNPLLDYTTASQEKSSSPVVDLLQETQHILNQMSQLPTSDSLKKLVNRAMESVKLQQNRLQTGQEASKRVKQHGGVCIFGLEQDSEEEEIQQCRMDDEDNGAVLILNLICTTVRFVRYPSTKLVALRLLERIARFSNDRTRLQRVVPYAVSLLADNSSIVRCTALRVLTSVLFMTYSIPQSDRRIFQDYIFPALVPFKADPSLNCRVAFAECLPRLAETSVRFLELSRAEELEKACKKTSPDSVCDTSPSLSKTTSSAVASGPSLDNSETKIAGNYDRELEELHNLVQDFVSNMVEQPAVVRRTLLCDITRLCLFFGRERTSGHLLPILITFLNERNDWQLRATFFEHIPGVSALVGPLALQQFLLPCIIQALQDVEELVIERTLSCLYALVTLGLLDSTMMVELTAKVVPLVFHPGSWIRRSVVRLLAALVSSERFGIVEVQVTLVHLLLPVLKEDVAKDAVLIGYKKDIDANEELLLEMLQDPLDRNVFVAAMLKLEREMNGVTSSSAPSSSSSSSSSSASASSTTTTSNTTTERGAKRDGTSSDSRRSPSGKSNLNSWLKLSHRKQDEESEKPRQESQSNESELQPSQEDMDHVSDTDRPKLALMEPYLRASVGARRGDRSRPSDAPSELPADYTRNLSKNAQLHSIVVPDQRYITLAIHNKYSEFLNLASSSMAPGSFLLHQHAAFQDLVNKYGIMSRSRRHGGGHGPNTSEAISAGETRLLHRIRALGVPPLPPDMGSLRRSSDGSHFVGVVRRSSSQLGSLCDDSLSARAPTTRDAASIPSDKPWRPRGVLAANLYGHDGAVNRICCSQDSLFFATGSDDGTVRVWLSSGLEDGFGIRPKLTYASQGGCITDLCMVENTHSIASASTAGTVHVFKIDRAFEVTRQAVDPNDTFGMVSSVMATPRTNAGSEELQGTEDNLLDRSEARRRLSAAKLQTPSPHKRRENASFSAAVSQRTSMATSTVIEIDLQQEGSIRSICHFPTLTQSMIAFASDSGAIHGWDLRNRSRAWTLRVGPQAGTITCIAVPPEGDALWLVAGTSRGVVLLFDLRFQILLKAWRHSSHSRIHRMYLSRATCSDPFVFIAAGSNEFALFNVSTGVAMHSFRSVSTATSVQQVSTVSNLEPVELASLNPLTGVGGILRPYNSMDQMKGLWENLGVNELRGPSRKDGGEMHSVRAILCPFDTMDSKGFHAHIPSAVISAGSDRRIRYWNVDNSLSYSIFDQEFGVSTKQFWDTVGTVSVCREDISDHKSSQPFTEGRGLPHPSSNHEDAILDLAFVRYNQPSSLGDGRFNTSGFLLSASRDGVVKAWV